MTWGVETTRTFEAPEQKRAVRKESEMLLRCTALSCFSPILLCTGCLTPRRVLDGFCHRRSRRHVPVDHPSGAYSRSKKTLRSSQV